MSREDVDDASEAALNALLDEYGSFLRRTITRLCPRDLGLVADEIEQDVRLRLWRTIQRDIPIRDRMSYIYRVAMTTTIDAIRRAKARREEPLDNGPEEAGDRPSVSPQDRLRQQEIVNQIRHALGTLNPPRRRAVGLHLQGLSSDEIADLLGWTEPKARNLVYRGLADLRARLRERGIDYEQD